jgi:hypothetical protein
LRTLRRHDGYVRFAKLRVIRLAALSVHSLRNVHKNACLFVEFGSSTVG